MAAALNSRLFELLAAPAPALSCGAAQEVARRHFGVVGQATPLDSERDQNLRIQAPSGQRYVLKVANPLESPDVTDLQTRALLHVAARDPAIPLPRVCRTINGETHLRIDVGSGRQSTVRLLTYLCGVPVSETEPTPRFRTDLGRCLARLGKALFDFSHPSAKHDLLWNLSNASSLFHRIGDVSVKEDRLLVTRWITHFDEKVVPRFSSLRSQVIYNDLNPQNVLVDRGNPECIAGIIDFGDMVYSPLVADVAVAAAYQLRQTPDPFEAVAQLVVGYYQESPLQRPEIELLFDLIATRLAMAVIITSWRASLYPDNRRYILRNAASHCDMLRRFEQISRDDVASRLRAACGITDV